GLKHVIFRPHNVYGPRQNLADKYRNVVGIFMNRLLHDQPMPIFGDGTQTRAFSYIGDVAPAIARSPLNPEATNRTFNLGSDRADSVDRLADLVAEALGLPAVKAYLPPRHEVHIAYCDHARARQAFPELTATPLPEGLARMAQWARQTEIPPAQSFEPLEIEAGLPPSWRP
ncbi:MAG: NAD-dependent epimerase/dehydratase family protein, partial [Planctomycetaceae bacterium]